MLPTSSLISQTKPTVDRNTLSEDHGMSPTDYKQVSEEAAVNNVGAGNIAGANGDPPVKPKNKYKKANELDNTNLLRRTLKSVQ